MEPTKKCSNPEHEGPNPLPVSEFSRRTAAKDGLQSRCKACKAEQKRRWNDANREHVAEYDRSYREEHRDELLERERTYREQHREQRAQNFARYYQAHHERMLARQRARYAANREQELESARQRYAANPQKYREIARQDHAANRERNNERSRQLRARWLDPDLRNLTTHCPACGLTFTNPDSWLACHPANVIRCLEPASVGLIARTRNGVARWGFPKVWPSNYASKAVRKAARQAAERIREQHESYRRAPDQDEAEQPPMTA
jgi:hypothetical protein